LDYALVSMPLLLRTLAFALALMTAIAPAHAHDVADEIAVTGFVKPSGNETEVLWRVPLAMLADLDLPQAPAGFVDLARVGPALRLAAGAVARAFALHDGSKGEGNVPLDHRIVALRVSPPGDREFETLDQARALIHGPALPADAAVPIRPGFVDIHLTYPAVADPILRINLSPSLVQRLHLGLRLVLPDGAIRPFEIKGAADAVRLDPSRWQAALAFVGDGARHIIGGADHLLFLLCLIVPFRRRFWPLVGVVTAFTVGHSITLVAAALGLVTIGRWFPPVVETLIAVSILTMAIENVLWARFERRWLIAAGFGLIHGFGFANALGESLQFAGAHLALSLFAFNLGIELGQIAVLVVAVPALNWLFRVEALRRYGVLLISIIVGHEAWHWMVERAGAIKWAELAAVEPAGAFGALAWLALAAFVLALAWPIGDRLRGWSRQIGA